MNRDDDEAWAPFRTKEIFLGFVLGFITGIFSVGAAVAWVIKLLKF